MHQIGRYQIVERLGRGAMGVVYRALDPRIGRSVAVKSIRLGEISDPSELKRLRERLEREARSAGALSHRNIVTIYDILEEEKLVHLFMEFVNGPSLEKMLNDRTLPDSQNLLSFFKQIASGLDYAHKIGIIHRDVKPSNLMLHFEHGTGEQIAKITDFGVAKFVSQQMTQVGSMMGTPNYMAPEQIEGAAISGQTDQFALAVVAYEVLTGEKAFVADYIPTLFFRIVRESPKPAHEVNPTLTPEIDAAIQKALAKDPAQRFESCTAFAAALSQACNASAEWLPPYRMGAVTPPPKEEFELEATRPIGASALEERATAENLSGGRRRPSVSIAPPPVIAVGDAPAPRETASAKSDEPVAPIYDLPYHLPELRRRLVQQDDMEEQPGLPLWRKIAIAALLLAMAGVGYAVYRNFTDGADAGAAPSSASTAAPPSSTETRPPSGQAASPVVHHSPAPAATHNTTAGTAEATRRVPQTKPRPDIELPNVSAGNVLAQPATPDASQPPLPDSTRPAARPSTLGASSVPVQFSSEPVPGKIVVDGDESKSCTTPCSIPLPYGRHTLTVSANNYSMQRRIFQVPDQRDVFVPLAQNIGLVQFDSQPAGSYIYVDGRLQGQTPATLKLSAGSHTVKVVSGNRSREQTIEVTADSLQNYLVRWQ